MEYSTLAGCSILVVEEEQFVARCLQVRLEDAGARIFSAASAAEALHFIDQEHVSAALLDYSSSAKDGHRIPRRLAALSLPFVFCKNIGRSDAWPHAPVLNKPVTGTQLIDTLCRLLRPGVGRVAQHEEPLPLHGFAKICSADACQCPPSSEERKSNA